MISKALEKYLKNIYVLKKQNGNVRVTDIAVAMDCSKPSVNKAVNNLKENGYLNYETYGTIEMTKKGEDLAKKILETYDIVYLFLKEVLGLDKSDAEKEAERIKSSMEDKTINKLAKYVHNVLDLGDLNCDYDVSKQRCRECARNKVSQD